ncbi:glutaredoxin [Rhizoclosmatium globosum]|uniref:Glutaredoxin n=1 Tax=Rhizoclosmatium globosum TaxID=329046 RepID=A0A1Y2CV40_9FUNG|nr:glutaredoxin [Rhizoclosmatium globosum]|eukprot:ORY50694.1 glutaredoxin [Rhizoclosmatium globosum]
MASKTNVATILSDEQFKMLAGSATISVANFYADWAEQCKDMNEVFDELSNKFPKLQFLKVEAEEYPDTSEDMEIAAVPTFLVIKQAEAYKPADVAAPAANFSEMTPEQLQARLKALINSNKVMVFLKGTPQEPRCGFSRQVVDLLTEQRTTYGSFNILADETVRAALKEYSNWPTYPQRNDCIGDFQKLAPPEDDINTRLKELINQSPVMLFMKGNPDGPRCGFSRQIVQLLRDQNVKFGYFDILEDDEVRQTLKEFSNWPTYPQLYANGELLGGLDIVKEMIASGDFASCLPPQ